MKVLFDSQIFDIQKFGGASRCFCELIKSFPSDIIAQISIMINCNIHLRNECLCFKAWGGNTGLVSQLSILLYKVMHKLFPCVVEDIHSLNMKKSIEYLERGDFDVFHATFCDTYFLPYLKGKPFVITVHDLIPELFPNYFAKDDIQIITRKTLVDKASAIVAVSEQTKRDLIQLYDVPEHKITVVYHAGPPKEIVTSVSLVKGPYFLYMGMRRDYKNFDQLVIDFSRFVHSHPQVKLICTGYPFSLQEQELFVKYKVVENIFHLNANDIQVKNLYANAIGFIYPSLYEGFGIPILEVFAYGCPVLLNNKSCFPEIASYAGVFFSSDAHSSNITEKLEEMYNLSNEKRKELINKGYKRLSEFSWEKSAKKLSEVYASII